MKKQLPDEKKRGVVCIISGGIMTIQGPNSPSTGEVEVRSAPRKQDEVIDTVLKTNAKISKLMLALLVESSAMGTELCPACSEKLGGLVERTKEVFMSSQSEESESEVDSEDELAEEILMEEDTTRVSRKETKKQRLGKLESLAQRNNELFESVFTKLKETAEEHCERCKGFKSIADNPTLAGMYT
jgi:hypothetical protein